MVMLTTLVVRVGVGVGVGVRITKSLLKGAHDKSKRDKL
jgi:hypothetical protein